MKGLILRSSFYLLLSQVIVKLVSFLYNIFLARNLTVEEFGLYTAALSYFSLVAALGDLGITRYLMREVSIHGEDKKACGTLISTAILSRIAVVSLFFLIFAFVLNLYDPDKLRSSLAILAVLAVLPQSISVAMDVTLISFSRAKVSAFFALIFNLLMMSLGVVFINLHFGVMGIVIALIISNLVYAFALTLVTVGCKVEILGKVSDTSFVEMLKGSLPYGLLAVMGLIYFKVDSLMLSYLKGNFETGIYGAAYRFLEAVIFVPSTVGLVLFPMLSKIHHRGSAELRTLFKDIFLYMGSIGVVTSIGFIFLLPIVVELFLPRYLLSIPVIQILSLAIPFIFIHVPLSQILLSSDKYLKQVIIASFLPLGFNILANLILIPTYGYMAAAWVTVLSDIISLLVLAILVQKSLLLSKS